MTYFEDVEKLGPLAKAAMPSNLDAEPLSGSTMIGAPSQSLSPERGYIV